MNKFARLIIIAGMTVMSFGEPLLLAFSKPEDVVKIPLKANLSPSFGKQVEWKNFGEVWTSQSSVKTHLGKMMKVGDVDNEVTCYFEGKSKEAVDYIIVKASCYNPDGEDATVKKFKEVCLLLAKELGIDEPDAVLKKVDPVKGKDIDTNRYKIRIEKLKYNLGYGWRLKIQTK